MCIHSRTLMHRCTHTRPHSCTMHSTHHTPCMYHTPHSHSNTTRIISLHASSQYTHHLTSGLETDIDCGGLDCSRCQAGLDCLIDNDCLSEICTAHCTHIHCTHIHCTNTHCTNIHCTHIHCTHIHCTHIHCTHIHCTNTHCTNTHCTTVCR
jgi:hypothetical protein